MASSPGNPTGSAYSPGAPWLSVKGFGCRLCLLQPEGSDRRLVKNHGVVAEQRMISHDTVDYALPCNYEEGIGATRKVGYSGWAVMSKKSSSSDNISVIRLPKLIFVSTNF